MKARELLTLTVGLLLTAALVVVPHEGAADAVLKTKNDKAQDLTWSNGDGTPALTCEGFTTLEQPPPGAGLHLLTIKTKGSQATEKQTVFYDARPGSNGSDCGHDHAASGVHPRGPIVSCHRYVWQNNKWVLVHVCDF